MTKLQGLLEKDRVVFAAGKSSAGRKSSIFRPASAMGTKLPAIDELLENTLVNKAGKLLTKRESEILKLIVAGKTNKKIAQALYRTERTIEYHRHRLMRKLEVHTAADLVKCAIAMGLV